MKGNLYGWIIGLLTLLVVCLIFAGIVTAPPPANNYTNSVKKILMKTVSIGEEIVNILQVLWLMCIIIMIIRSGGYIHTDTAKKCR